MKKIVVTTDFSECSENALIYSLSLCKVLNASLYLLHVFHIPVPATDMPYISVSSEEEEKNIELRLEELITRVKYKTGYEGVIHTITDFNFTVDGILSVVRDTNPDLLVMGQRGNTTLADRLFGSTATAIINLATCPLLLIPEKCQFNRIKKIAIACDKKTIDNINKVHHVIEMNTAMKPEVLLFNVVQNEGEENRFNREDFSELIGKGVKLFFPIHHDIHEGILQFVNDNDADWLCLFPHRHNIFEQWFTRLNSGNISQQVKIPLLLVNELVQ